MGREEAQSGHFRTKSKLVAVIMNDRKGTGVCLQTWCCKGVGGGDKGKTVRLKEERRKKIYGEKGQITAGRAIALRNRKPKRRASGTGFIRKKTRYDASNNRKGKKMAEQTHNGWKKGMSLKRDPYSKKKYSPRLLNG